MQQQHGRTSAVHPPLQPGSRTFHDHGLTHR